MRWYRLAAEQGLAEAQTHLGVMYADGRGVPQDYAEAVRWYRLAAEQGLAIAQTNLGFMYVSGKGIAENLLQAHMWFNLATAQVTGEDRTRYVEARDAIAKQMTSKQIAEAQRLAREWTPTTER